MAKHKPLVIALLHRDITQIELSRRTGIHEARLSRIFNLHDVPNALEKKHLARVLRTTVEALFPSDDEALAS